MKSIKRSKSLTEEAFDILQDAIIKNHLEFNKLYSATELGIMLGGISRTPVREAAQRLERMGIVKIEKNKGIRIIPTSLEMMIESFQIRLMLEVPMIKHATKIRTQEDINHVTTLFNQFKKAATSGNTTNTLKSDRDYHLALLQVVGNQKAIDIITNTRNQVLIAGSATIPKSRSCLDTFNDHLLLQEAFVKGDVKGAGLAMKNHILNTAKLLISQESAEREHWIDCDPTQLLAWTS